MGTKTLQYAQGICKYVRADAFGCLNLRGVAQHGWCRWHGFFLECGGTSSYVSAVCGCLLMLYSVTGRTSLPRKVPLCVYMSRGLGNQKQGWSQDRRFVCRRAAAVLLMR